MRLNRPTPQPAPPPPARRRLLRRIVLAALCLMLLAGIGVAAAAAWLLRDLPPLPSVDGLALQRPAQPLRIYSSDGELLAEYGEERRELTPLAEMPAQLRQAVLAIEDARFYEHDGVDWQGLARAAWANLLHGRHGQGASTITMQLARNLYLGREKTYRRKLQEIRLAWRLEQTYSKDRLLERYMNQIYLGERAYGFAAAANIYFGKPVAQLSLAESAMLAGLPKAPSAYNPVSDPLRARQRQQYILRRMLELGWIDGRDYRSAVDERLALARAVPA
ncbi:transglycosylase domain-containing protein [Chitinimonas koreensis]|uniref:transglycosylase domain-containing protein n=1 Tax=Chitinimonas koreensis TaxID=356302 RepID=UPI00223EE8D0|nr:transglycosylase domain-containing protein [Chitinimonas koreensis]